MMNVLRYLIQVLLVLPLMRGLLGLNLYHGERLPQSGPAVIVANHNSHLDALLIMTLLPLSLINKIRPVGARDYFFKNRMLAWCVTHLFGVIPVSRGDFRASHGNPLRECSEALSRNEILVIFPEGTRGEPGRIEPFKPGISHLSRQYPDIPFIPIFIDGLETVLPKGARFPIPLVCDVYVGNAIRWRGNRKIFMKQILNQIETMKHNFSRRPTNRLQSIRSGRFDMRKYRDFA